MICYVLWFFFLLIPQAVSQDGQVAHPEIRPMIWERDFNPAFQKASEYDLPVMIIHLVRGDTRNEAHLSLYNDPDVKVFSRSFPCLIADPCLHDEIDGEGEFLGKKVCAIYRTLACSEHQDVDRAVTVAFVDDDNLETESTCFFVAPRGDLISRNALPSSRRNLITLMEEALQAVNPEAFDEALKKLSAARIERFRKAIHQAESPELRRAAIKRLVLLEDVSALSTLYDESGREEIRIEFLRYTAAPGKETYEGWLSLKLEKESGAIRNHAAVSLEIIGSSKAVPALLRTLEREKTEEIRKNIIRALCECGPMDRKVQAAVKRCLSSRNALLRKNAYLCLYRMEKVSAFRKKILNAGLKDKDPGVRVCAAWVLGWIGTEADIPLLENMIKREQGRDRQFVLMASGAIQKLKGKDYEAFLGARSELGEDRIPRTGAWPPPAEDQKKKESEGINKIGR